MRPPRPVVVFSRDELQRSDWCFALRHHSPSKAGIYYAVEATGDIRLLNELIALGDVDATPLRALVLCAKDLREAEALLANIRRAPPTVVLTAKRIEEEWPMRPACVGCVTHERWVVFAHLDVISELKRGPKKGSRHHADALVPA
jgi:hypothetical protein